MTWTAPRTWVTSEVVTAATMNTHIRDNLLALADRIQVVDKTADESRTSTTTLADDAHLFFAVVAGATYVFQVVMFTNSGTQLADVKAGLTFPAGTMTFGLAGMDVGATTPTGSMNNLAIASATSGTSVVTFAAGGVTMATINGRYACTTGGTVKLQWAQNTSSASAVTMTTGSFLTATRKAA